MKKIIASGVLSSGLAGGYCASLSGSVPDGQWQTIFRVFSERQPCQYQPLTVSDLPIGSLLYSYGRMIITHNERWEIARSGSLARRVSEH
ncbi:hypothetical protein MJ560_07650 [Klebsiella pneumoniae]|nr:hypothetical protein MJ560_07650 [Klebsiella pneumoniae]